MSNTFALYHFPFKARMASESHCQRCSFIVLSRYAKRMEKSRSEMQKLVAACLGSRFGSTIITTLIEEILPGTINPSCHLLQGSVYIAFQPGIGPILTTQLWPHTYTIPKMRGRMCFKVENSSHRQNG